MHEYNWSYYNYPKKNFSYILFLCKTGLDNMLLVQIRYDEYIYFMIQFNIILCIILKILSSQQSK